jgi:tetrahydromethanopterin S-methyltransferase subunit G
MRSLKRSPSVGILAGTVVGMVIVAIPVAAMMLA